MLQRFRLQDKKKSFINWMPKNRGLRRSLQQILHLYEWQRAHSYCESRPPSLHWPPLASAMVQICQKEAQKQEKSLGFLQLKKKNWRTATVTENLSGGGAFLQLRVFVILQVHSRYHSLLHFSISNQRIKSTLCCWMTIGIFLLPSSTCKLFLLFYHYCSGNIFTSWEVE